MPWLDDLRESERDRYGPAHGSINALSVGAQKGMKSFGHSRWFLGGVVKPYDHGSHVSYGRVLPGKEDGRIQIK